MSVAIYSHHDHLKNAAFVIPGRASPPGSDAYIVYNSFHWERFLYDHNVECVCVCLKYKFDLSMSDF